MVCIQLISLILQIPDMFYWAGENEDTLLTEDQNTIPACDNERIGISSCVLGNTHSYNL